MADESINDDTSIVIPMLGETNRKTWEQQVLDAIKKHHLENHLYPDSVPVQYANPKAMNDGIETQEYRRWREEDKSLISFLFASMNSNLTYKMVGCIYCFEIWHKIKDYFAKTTEYRVNQLKEQLKLITKSGLSASDYILRVKAITDSLAELGSPVSANEHIEAILKGLDEDHKKLITSIATAPKTLPLSVIENLLLSHEDVVEKLFRRKPNSLLAQSGKGSQFGYGGRRGIGGRQFRRGRRSWPKCEVCGKHGHLGLHK